MFERLQEVEKRYDELTEKLGDPQLLADPKEYQRVAKMHADLVDIVAKYREYKRTHQEKLDTEELLREQLDEEMRNLAQAELDRLKERERQLEQELRIMLLPKDPNDEKNVIIEIRAGTGGEEAALFAGDLLRMYSRYAERKHWKTELLSANETGIGGFKEAIMGG